MDEEEMQRIERGKPDSAIETLGALAFLIGIGWVLFQIVLIIIEGS